MATDSESTAYRVLARKYRPSNFAELVGQDALVGPDGAVAVAGMDVGEVAADGRLRRITGFFGGLPEA